LYHLKITKEREIQNFLQKRNITSYVISIFINLCESFRHSHLLWQRIARGVSLDLDLMIHKIVYMKRKKRKEYATLNLGQWGWPPRPPWPRATSGTGTWGACAPTVYCSKTCTATVCLSHPVSLIRGRVRVFEMCPRLSISDRTTHNCTLVSFPRLARCPFPRPL